MKTIFDHLKNILEDKKSEEFVSSDFSPFIIQRWLSMISPEFCYFINEKVNSINLPDNESWYRYYLLIIPKIGYRNIKYLKKNKATTKELSDVSKKLEISKRELKEYLEIDKDFIKKNNSIEIFKK